MSVNPVQGFGSGSEVPLGEAQPPSRQSQSDPSPEAAVKGLSPPDVGTLPKQESSISNHAPAADEVPQDEVKLQQDTEIKDQVIVRYLDKASGQVVLQVPSDAGVGGRPGNLRRIPERGGTPNGGYEAATVIGEGEKSYGS